MLIQSHPGNCLHSRQAPRLSLTQSLLKFFFDTQTQSSTTQLPHPVWKDRNVGLLGIYVSECRDNKM